MKKMNETTKRRLLDTIEMLTDATDGCSYGLTIENDGVMWRLICWTHDSFVYEVRGHGKTLDEAVEQLGLYDDHEDSEALKKTGS